MVKKSHRIKEEIGSPTDEVVTIHDELRRERLLRDTDKNIIIPRAITDWLLRSYFYISFVSLSTCSFHLREQMKTILVPIVYIHICSVQNKDGRNQERALLAPSARSVSTHLSIRCGGARVSRSLPEKKKKAAPSFSVVSKLDGPIRCAQRSTAKKRRARASSFCFTKKKNLRVFLNGFPSCRPFFFSFSPSSFSSFSSSSPLR